MLYEVCGLRWHNARRSDVHQRQPAPFVASAGKWTSCDFPASQSNLCSCNLVLESATTSLVIDGAVGDLCLNDESWKITDNMMKCTYREQGFADVLASGAVLALVRCRCRSSLSRIHSPARPCKISRHIYVFSMTSTASWHEIM